ncbi:ATP-binding protein [Streptomyces sp. NPDC088785]|uniref:ATP-binding protein n=1 Tax=Streptomyces sp. NPDC088785 TaxID=3365897 RepID=UPI0038263A0E
MTCAEARSRVRAALQPLCETLPPRQATLLVQDACLVTSELVTNALLHGAGVRDFDVGVRGTALTIRVGDHSTDPPTPRAPAPAVPGGNGWIIIRRLAAEITIEPDAAGKTISVVLDAARMAA